ncbi:hypothetical protein Dimus_025651 [Dionaea muscipula]
MASHISHTPVAPRWTVGAELSESIPVIHSMSKLCIRPARVAMSIWPLCAQNLFIQGHVNNTVDGHGAHICNS